MRLTKSVAVEAATKNLEKREALLTKAQLKVNQAKDRLAKAITANTPKVEPVKETEAEVTA